MRSEKYAKWGGVLSKGAHKQTGAAEDRPNPLDVFIVPDIDERHGFMQKLLSSLVAQTYPVGPTVREADRGLPGHGEWCLLLLHDR